VVWVGSASKRGCLRAHARWDLVSVYMPAPCALEVGETAMDDVWPPTLDIRSTDGIMEGKRSEQRQIRYTDGIMEGERSEQRQ
jgi:hypothetical protein